MDYWIRRARFDKVCELLPDGVTDYKSYKYKDFHIVDSYSSGAFKVDIKGETCEKLTGEQLSQIEEEQANETNQ